MQIFDKETSFPKKASKILFMKKQIIVSRHMQMLGEYYLFIQNVIAFSLTVCVLKRYNPICIYWIHLMFKKKNQCTEAYIEYA